MSVELAVVIFASCAFLACAVFVIAVKTKNYRALQREYRK